MDFKIAKNGWSLIFKLGVLAVIFLVLYLYREMIFVTIMPYILLTCTIALFAIFGFSFYFFRDPDRITPTGENLVISPADGKVIKVENINEDEYCKEEMVLISVFMSVFNVHVNRFPVSGTIEYKNYHQGLFLAAWNHKASTDNEQMMLGINTGKEKIAVKQIAGLVARRIVCEPNSGEQAVKGERYGLIKFGSRLDIYLPKSAAIKVQIGDKVVAGESILAELSREESVDNA